MTKLFISLFLLLFPLTAWGRVISADILSTTTITVGENADEVRFMPDKLVSVDTSRAEVKTYIEPKIEFDRWNKEETLSLSIPSDVGYTDKTVDDKTGEVVMRNSQEGFYFKKYDNDIVKFGCIFYEPQKSYQRIFKLIGWENFDFYYQHELTEDEIKRGFIRTDDIVGSYAIYHKTKKNYRTDGINYGTGKFAHIKRPRYLDADGKFICWANLNIDNGIYTLTPESEDLIRSSKHPIKTNDTLGYTTVGQSVATATENAYTGNAYTGIAGTLSAVTMGLFGNGGSSSTYKVGIYNLDGNNKPQTLITNSDATVVLAAGQGAYPPNATNLASSSVTGTMTAVNYWFLFNVTNSYQNRICYDSGTAAVVASGSGTYDYTAAMHSSVTGTDFTISSGTVNRYTVYYTYTPSGGGATPRRRIIIISKHENTIPTRFLLSDCYIRRKVSRTA